MRFFLLPWLLHFLPDGGDGGGGGDGGAGGDDGSKGAPPPDPQNAGGDGDKDKGDKDAPDPAAERAKELEAQAAAAEKRAKEAEAKLKELEKKDLDDKGKAETERDEQKELAETLASANHQLRVELAATKVGIRPEAAHAAAALIDWTKVDNADDPKVVETKLKGLKEKHEYLFAVEKGKGVDGGAGRKGDTPEEEIEPGLGRLRHAYDNAKT